MCEIWKDIKGFKGVYQASNKGRIRSYKNNRWGLSKNPKILKQKPVGKEYKQDNHYLGVSLNGKSYRVHRLIAETFISNPKDKAQVNHKDGVKNNNCVDNLEWSTHAENWDHSTKNGYMPRGENHHNSKLTKMDVLFIKIASRDKGYFYGVSELAEKFSVSEKTIKNIVSGKSWSHL